MERGYDPTLGARPLRRAIQRMVEDPLSERLLYKQFRAGELVIVDAELDPETDEMVMTFRSVEGFEVPSASTSDSADGDGVVASGADAGAGEGGPEAELAEAGPAAE